MKYTTIALSIAFATLLTSNVHAASENWAITGNWNPSSEFSRARIPGDHQLTVSHTYPVYFWQSVTCDDNTATCSGINYQ
jgi:hypothetical protein